MQETAREHWANVVSNDGIPDPLGDFGFYHAWDYVRDTCDLCIASGFQLLPRQGGIDDQDPLWIADLKQYLAGRNRAKYEANPNDWWGNPEATPQTTATVPLNLPDWRTGYD